MARWRSLLVMALILTASAGGGTYYYFYKWKAAPQTQKITLEYKTPEEADQYVRFVMEAFDSIQKNYWQKASDADLANLFDLSVQKATNGTTTPAAKDRSGIATMLAGAFSKISNDDDKRQLAVNTVIVALYNLAPAGRNQLLSTKQEKALRQEVANVNPSKDLYADVGAKQGDSKDVVEAAFKETKQKLEKATSTEAKQQLASAEYAHKVLAADDTKARYDQAKVEPTIFTHTLGATLYLYVEKMSPTTLDEFVAAIKASESNKDLDSAIIDLRGNIGGALDIAPYWIGFWMGLNQYTFDLFHQGDYTVERSPIGKLEGLDRFRDVAILTDNMTQSTAEVLSAALKKFHLAHTVGSNTRGWGTVENTFPLTNTVDASTTYTLLLVHSLTLRDDNQPIEGRGVDPDINIADKNWQSQLAAVFRSASLISVLKKEAAKPPLRD